MSPAEFWELTWEEYAALADRWYAAQEQHSHELRFLAACMFNSSGNVKRPIEPDDFLPNKGLALRKRKSRSHSGDYEESECDAPVLNNVADIFSRLDGFSQSRGLNNAGEYAALLSQGVVQ